MGKKYFFIFLILLLSLIPISDAESEDKSKISFVEGDLIFQNDYLKYGVNISIRSDLKLSEDVLVRISDLSTGTGHRISSSNIISQWPSPKNISAGKVEIFPIRFKEEITAPPGTYSGKLIVTASNADAISKDFTLIIPSNLSKFTVLTKEITINGTRWIPGLYTSFSERNVYFGRKNAANLSNLNLSAIIANGGEKEGKVLLLAEKAKFEDGYIGVPLKIEGISSPGKYGGTLYLDQFDPEKSEKIKIAVIVNDFILWPFLVILVGVMISYGLTNWWKDGRFRMKLKDKIWSLRKEAVLRQRHFAEEHHYMPYSRYSIHHSIQLRLDDMEDDVNWIIDATKLPTIQSEIDTIDDYLEKFTPLLIQAERLFNKFISYDSELAERGEQVDPIFFKDTQDLLAGQQIFAFNEKEPSKKSEFESLEEKLKEKEEFLDSFYSMYNKLSECEDIISTLERISANELEQNERKILYDLKKESGKYKESLKNIKDALWKAGALKVLQDKKIEEEINDLLIRISNIRQDAVYKIKIFNVYLQKGQNTKTLDDQLEKKLFLNHEETKIKLTPETYEWLEVEIPQDANEETIEDIDSFIKEQKDEKYKIEFRPEIIICNTNVEIWSDLGYIPFNRSLLLVPFEWSIHYVSRNGIFDKIISIITKSEEESQEKPKEVIVPGWDWVVPSFKHEFEKPGNYRIELTLGGRSLSRKDIQVKGRICYWITAPYTTIKRLLHEIRLNRADVTTALLSFFVAVITILIASIAGVTFLYPGEGFGSLRDYLVALIWGSTADQATKLLEKASKLLEVSTTR